jgi:hypothetical protein
VLIRVARVDGENLRRIAQAEPEFYHEHVEEPLLASGMDEQQMRAAASQMSEQRAGVVQRMLVALYTRHQERHTIEHLVEQVSLPHGGQPVKSLGDGVIFHFKRPGQGMADPVPLHRATRPA